MYWTPVTTWPENALVIQGMLKPVTPDLEPDDPNPAEPAKVMRGMERSAGAVVELATRLGWVWARHPEVRISGELLFFADGSQGLATKGEIEMAFVLESMGAVAGELQ